jgi:hypothetical protein
LKPIAQDRRINKLKIYITNYPSLTPKAFPRLTTLILSLFNGLFSFREMWIHLLICNGEVIRELMITERNK